VQFWHTWSYEERLTERNYAASQLAEAKERLKAATAYAQAQIRKPKLGFSKLTDRKL